MTTEEQQPLSEEAQQAIDAIARGENPSWEIKLKHPRYGELTFKVNGLPNNQAWLRHAVRTDQLVAEAGGVPGQAGSYTSLYAASLAAMPLEAHDGETTRLEPGIFEPIVIDERQHEEEGTGQVKVERTFYNPLTDTDQSLVMQAWMAFSTWRAELLRGADRLGNSSGENRGSESDGSSPAATASPSTIPA